VDANPNTPTSSTVAIPLLIHRQTARLFGDELVNLILDESTMYRSGLLQLAHQPSSLPQSPSRQIGARLFRLCASLLHQLQLLPQSCILLQNKLKRLLGDAFATGCWSCRIWLEHGGCSGALWNREIFSSKVWVVAGAADRIQPIVHLIYPILVMCGTKCETDGALGILEARMTREGGLDVLLLCFGQCCYCGTTRCQ